MPSPMPSIRLNIQQLFGDESLVQAIPEDYWPQFVNLFREGVMAYFPPPNPKRMYWRVDRSGRSLELLFFAPNAGAAVRYFDKLCSNSLDFFVTKQDWDKRFTEILRDSA